MTEPRVVDIVTTPALFPNAAPCASFTATVMTDVAVPFAVIEDGEAVTDDSCRDATGSGSGSGSVVDSQLRLTARRSAATPIVRNEFFGGKIPGSIWKEAL